MNDKLKTLLKFALDQKKHSKCEDKKTSAILISHDCMQIYSIGINGGPRGGTNCLCDKCHAHEKYSCVHAEMNCLVKNTHIDDEPKILISSKQPCAMCASLMVNAGTNIKKVYYNQPYWDGTGLRILRDAGIETIQFDEVEL